MAQCRHSFRRKILVLINFLHTDYFRSFNSGTDANRQPLALIALTISSSNKSYTLRKHFHHADTGTLCSVAQPFRRFLDHRFATTSAKQTLLLCEMLRNHNSVLNVEHHITFDDLSAGLTTSPAK